MQEACGFCLRDPARSCLCGDSRGSHCAGELISQEAGRQPLNLLWGPEGWSSCWKSCGEQGVLGGEGRDFGESELSNVPIVSVPAKDRHTVGV